MTMTKMMKTLPSPTIMIKMIVVVCLSHYDILFNTKMLGGCSQFVHHYLPKVNQQRQITDQTLPLFFSLA